MKKERMKIYKKINIISQKCDYCKILIKEGEELFIPATNGDIEYCCCSTECAFDMLQELERTNNIIKVDSVTKRWLNGESVEDIFQDGIDEEDEYEEE